MSNVFVDLGAYNGDSVEQFRNWRKLAFPDKEVWDIYAFDPNPGFHDKWKTIQNPRTHFYQQAAWIEDCEKDFAIDETGLLGSTLMEGKRKVWEQGVFIKVECFDFSEWLAQYEEDYVVVKMDIEGAEFLVLDKMIKDGTIQIADKLLVEFHPNKVKEYTTDDKNRLIKLIQDLGVDILEWH